ncbi:uncharacterized protein LOC144625482 isoform X4 [Crassostrea virginica]
MQLRPLFWFLEWIFFSSVVGLECIEQQTYFEFYEERFSQRNVTKNVSTCCQGYIKTTEKCLLNQEIPSPASDSGSAYTFVVPVVILLLMLLVSIAIVYHLHSKGKSCSRLDSRKNESKKISYKPTKSSQDEGYTAYHPSMASDSGHYTELGGPPTAVTRSESPEEGGKTDYTDQGHYDYLSSMVEVHGASEMKSNSE